MPKTKNRPDYSSLNQELQTILERLQQPDILVDEAVQLYEQGLAVLAQLEKYLQTAEHTIKKLGLQASRAED